MDLTIEEIQELKEKAFELPKEKQDIAVGMLLLDKKDVILAVFDMMLLIEDYGSAMQDAEDLINLIKKQGYNPKTGGAYDK